MHRIQTFEIPVEIFCFFAINNQNAFTVGDVRTYLKQHFKETVQEHRIRTILKALTASGKLKAENKATPRTKNACVPHYSFNRLI